MSDDGGRFARWSQRKAAARRGGALPAEPDEAPVPVPTAEMSRRPRANGKTPRLRCPIPRMSPRRRRPKTKLSRNCRPSRNLTSNPISPCSCAKNVPEALKRAALRKLWGSDPVLANLDGLNDYGEDFNVIDTPITLAQTSYRVGKGYFDEAEEKLSKLGDARTAQPDKSSNARRGESSKRSAESPVAADSGDAPDQAPRENVAAVEEEPAATRQVAAAGPESGTAKSDDDKPD